MIVRTMCMLVVLLVCLPAQAQEAPPDADGDPTTVLAFKDVRVEQLIPFIVEATGKVVMPQPGILDRPITIINDQPIPRDRALDMVFLALAQAGVGVVATDEIITLRDITEMESQTVPVIGPDESVLDQPKTGVIAEKIYRLTSSTASALGEILADSIPDTATLTVDEQSNQIAVKGTMALLQRIERLINAMDRPAAGALVSETFRLRYAGAEEIADNIRELYEVEETPDPQASRRARIVFARRGGDQEEESAPGVTGASLRVTANTQQNAVTVIGTPSAIDQIRALIENDWDLPLPDEAVVPRIYELANSDPIKVRDLLRQLFGDAQTGEEADSGQGVGRLAGEFAFEAIPEAGRLVVVATSPDNLTVIDSIIEGLDQPRTIGLPELVELKHASAAEIAEQLNTLLAESGTLAQLPRQEEGLSQDADTGAASPYASDTTAEGEEAPTDPGLMSFWWQRSRPPTEASAASNLIGSVRLVPVWRQNAVLVLAPPEYKQAIVQLVHSLDQPGRQVLLSAVIAEVTREDATALGLRWSSEGIDLANSDNSIGIGLDATGQATNILGSLFDTSILNAQTNLNVVLQALNQQADVNILSEPKIFTSDNQEAEFFDGQDIPFVTDSQVTETGNQINSFDYRAVGIRLAARPRITTSGNIDLRVNIELSSIASGETLFGAFVVDRRETTTQVVVQDGQTIVISGILRSELVDVVRKVPLLGDIPLLGALFRSIDQREENTELLVFITPIVVNNEAAIDEVNEPYRERLEDLRDQLGTPDVDRDAADGESPP